MKYPKPGAKPKKEKQKKQSSIVLKPDQRMKIYQKYGGRCAYCGNGIEYNLFQVDHKLPKRQFRDVQNADFWENLMPSCRRCNHYKRAHSLEYFRKLLMTIQDRISNDYLVKVAIDYGVVNFTPFDGVFYFEKQNGVG
jgi:5-methylcytosine-specific restriction endonuclease McrA